MRRKPAHPRSRGEHVAVFLGFLALCGSSPLARGTSAGQIGKTLGFLAHPRSRGEHPSTSNTAVAVIGSSPLARGTSSNRDSSCLPIRLIPARAGNMKYGMKNVNCVTAHPRSRGEHLITEIFVLFAAGSSPLARGTLRQGASDYGCGRLIPARAGNMS